MQQMSANAVQFLAQKAPGNPNMGEYGQQTEWEPSDAEMGVWNRYLTAAEKPMTLVHDFTSGHLAPETVETVKALYPNFYSKTVAAIGQYLAEKQPTISFDRRLQLSILMQAPVEPSLRQDNLLALQMGYAKTEGAPGMPQKALKGAGESQMTPGQRLSSR